MALLRRKIEQDNRPIGSRLRAWWRGEMLALIGGNGDAAPLSPWGAVHVAEGDGGKWDSQTLKAAQMIWGHALLGPCSPDDLAALAVWLKPRRSLRVAIMGAGLGGLSFALSRSCNCRVTGFEQADVLLQMCPDRNQGHLRALDSITLKTERSFDHAVIDGFAHRAGDIAPLIQPAALLVSQRGSMVIRAYLATDEARAEDRFCRWAESEPVTPAVPNQDELLRLVERVGFEVVDERDMADVHVAGIESRWTAAVDLITLLHSRKNHRQLIPSLVAEAQRWQERAELIRDGKISVMEVQARRRRA